MANRIDILQPYARPATAPTYDFMPVKHAIFILLVYIYTFSILRVYFNILFHACQGFLSGFCPHFHNMHTIFSFYSTLFLQYFS